ncbi:MAG TPA: nucleotidyl transferase AbiEii/AbiGii toxin family protein [Thermoanaerobaculia bacterium]|nr:nucleotidyl transferase AbiEii/AbiGii toxin family protein [Thermoanaerobaculia bacterium]
MIERQEIVDVANDLSLSPDIVEKDYTLGWLLDGIFTHERLAPSWVFKGGTCLKKCYFETYRFSEDLDFTVADETQLAEESLRASLAEVAAKLYDDNGLEIPVERLRFKVYRNPRGGLSCEGRVYYNGPLRRSRSSDLPRIRLDLTLDEIVLLPPVLRAVVHPYSDRPGRGMVARCYAYEEVFAEKIRALGDRTRPRDLYDVVNLYRHGEFHPAAASILDVLRQKCAFKGIPVPTLASLADKTDELLVDWRDMLGHQLPALPPLESFLEVLPEFFAWLAGAAVPTKPPALPMNAGEELLRLEVGGLRRQGIAGSSHLEVIRFAAANRLCVDLDYRASVRRIEPYSLRRTRAGGILLYAIRADSGEVRSYRLERIGGARATDQRFIPRYVVELLPTDAGNIPPTARGSRRGRSLPRRRRR